MQRYRAACRQSSGVDLGPHTQLLKIGRVRKPPVPLLSARFSKYAEVVQHLNRFAGRGLGRLKEFHYGRDSNYRVHGELFDQSDRHDGGTRRCKQAQAVLADERENFSGSSDSLICDRRYAF